MLINFDFPFQNYELEVSNRVEHEGCVKRRNAKTQKRVKAEAKAKSFWLFAQTSALITRQRKKGVKCTFAGSTNEMQN